MFMAVIIPSEICDHSFGADHLSVLSRASVFVLEDAHFKVLVLFKLSLNPHQKEFLLLSCSHIESIQRYSSLSLTNQFLYVINSREERDSSLQAQ